MSTRPILILTSEHEAVTKSLEQYVRLFVGEDLPHKIDSITRSSQEELLAKLDDLKHEEIINTVVVFDLTATASFTELNVAASDCFPAELALSYPEIYWIFIYQRTVPTYNKTAELADMTKMLHFVNIFEMARLGDLLKRHAGGLRTIFDPTALRWQLGLYVRDNRNVCTICASEKGEEANQIKTAVSIDEEKSFSLLNGYLLYRYGFSTYVVSTLSEMIDVFKKDKNSPDVAPDYVLEDVNLRFPDASGEQEKALYLVADAEMANACLLRKRQEIFENLPVDSKRIIISQATREDLNYWAGPILQKPFGGVFEEKLPSDLCMYGSIFYQNDDNEAKGNHSAPNINQKIAEALMRRARAIASEVKSVEEAIHAAVLAVEAKRLLGGKTLALSLEALKIKHCMEVTAECAFVGAADRLYVGRRFKEIKKDIKLLTENYRQQYSSLVEIAETTFARFTGSMSSSTRKKKPWLKFAITDGSSSMISCSNRSNLLKRCLLRFLITSLQSPIITRKLCRPA